MTDMNFNTTVNDTIFQGDMWPFVIFNENNNITTGRNALFFSSGHDNGDCFHVYLFTDTIFWHHRKYRHHDLNCVIVNTIHRHVVTFIFKMLNHIIVHPFGADNNNQFIFGNSRN